ncbi:hypothetical protein ACQV2F_23540, partial [Pantoea allii]|uniref:hypothetical protein n=1 Tax=Pantoea allii TaxID=574096 RepID=UPI003D318675
MPIQDRRIEAPALAYHAVAVGEQTDGAVTIVESRGSRYEPVLDDIAGHDGDVTVIGLDDAVVDDLIADRRRALVHPRKDDVANA